MLAVFSPIHHRPRRQKKVQKRAQPGRVLLVSGTRPYSTFSVCLFGNFTQYPVDTVKSVIQTQPVGKPTGFVTVLKAHVNAHGARYLWSGFSACMARAFILNGATFFGYEYTLERLDERLDE